MKTRHLFTGMGRSTPSPVAKKIYREEDKGRNAFFRFLAASPLRLACCLVLIGLLAGCGRQPVSSGRQASVETSLPTRAAPTPTAVEQVTHTPTASPTATPSPRPTRTSTPTQTATPSPTRTPTATASATPSPSPSPTQTQTPTPAPPTSTPSPTSPPTPSLDFRVLSYRLWPLDLNSGCAKGMHTIFIVVLDANGAPLDGVVVGDSWNNVEEVSGRKGPGRTEINLWANAMEIMVKRDAASGQAYSSEIGPMFGSFLTDIPNEQLAQAGYCANEAHCQWMRENDGYHCGGHYSWEVIFQKQAP